MFFSCVTKMDLSSDQSKRQCFVVDTKHYNSMYFLVIPRDIRIYMLSYIDDIDKTKVARTCKWFLQDLYSDPTYGSSNWIYRGTTVSKLRSFGNRKHVKRVSFIFDWKCKIKDSIIEDFNKAVLAKEFSDNLIVDIEVHLLAVPIPSTMNGYNIYTAHNAVLPDNISHVRYKIECEKKGPTICPSFGTIYSAHSKRVITPFLANIKHLPCSVSYEQGEEELQGFVISQLFDEEACMQSWRSNKLFPVNLYMKDLRIMDMVTYVVSMY